jgi:nicotinamide-nucleotide amidase
MDAKRETRNAKRCILICVGSELLRGKLNTHASHISRRLASIGLSLNEENTIADDVRELTDALRRALDRFDVVLVSGGLGPTFDDLTREASSAAAGRRLVLSQDLLNGLRKKFRRARYRMPPANARQAFLLDGARMIPNGVGTAPGQWLELGRGEGRRAKGAPHPSPLSSRLLILLPGPPRELYPMLESFVLPRLKRIHARPPTAESHLHFVGVPESVVDMKIRPIIARQQGGTDRVQFTILAHLGLVDLDIFVSHGSLTHAKKTLNRIVLAVRKAVGGAWYGSDDAYPLEKVVGDNLRRRRQTVAVAESCTGGLLASRLTDIPGSSDYFIAGAVTYANAAKRRDLGVPGSLLKKHGAVSRQVALAMARGIRVRAGTTWGVGITGIAGPGGGTPKKPVGLVYVALASGQRAVCNAYHFTGNRDAIRQRAVLAALDLLRRV